jgi:uncharacterized protein
MDKISFYLYKRDHTIRHYLKLVINVLVGFLFLFLFFIFFPLSKELFSKVFINDFEKAVIGETPITVEIVDTNLKMAKGLSGRESIPKNHSMLFVFETLGYHGIWMKNMEFPIDIIWLNEHSEVIHIEEKVLPNSFPKVYEPDKPALFVLELNANFVKENNIKIGDRFVLP